MPLVTANQQKKWLAFALSKTPIGAIKPFLNNSELTANKAHLFDIFLVPKNLQLFVK